MFVAHALMSLTVFAVLAFFVLFAAQKAEGLTRILGRALGVWLLILAFIAAIGAATAPMMGGRPFGLEMQRHMTDAHCYGRPAAPASPSTPGPAD
jgi:hypothetical protein